MNTFAKSLIILICFLPIQIGYSQSDCGSIQCDCENIPDAEKDPGLIALCKYYENALKERCENGEKNLKCKDNAKGPNAWASSKNTSAGSSTNLSPKTNDEVAISRFKNISEIRYCKQLKAFVEQKGFEFGNVSVPPNSNYFGYFQQAWAYDVQGKIYVIGIMSQKKVSGFAYSLDVKYTNFDAYQYFVFCNVSQGDWKKFSAPCSDCSYDDRFNSYIKKRECDCL